MTRRRLVAVGLALATGGYLARVAAWRPYELSGPVPADGFTRLSGVVHVHTTLSDGGGTPEEVISAARAARLDFVGITDHNNLDAKPLEGDRDGVLVLVGTEISTTAGHLLGLGLESDPVFRFSGDPLDALDDVKLLGGRSFLAHPANRRAEFLWTRWDAPGDWGLELLNGDSQWREAGIPRLARTALLYLVNPRYALLSSLGDVPDALSRWDSLLARRDVAGISGADAHSSVRVRKQKSLRFPSYEALFSVARSVVLLDQPLSGDATLDSRRIVEALARGRSYVGLEGLAPASEFVFEGRTTGGQRVAMGETAAPGTTLAVGGRIPDSAVIRLLRDGRNFAQGRGSIQAVASEPGAYRVEVRLPSWEVPWVLSNPIYIFGATEAEARARRLEAPSPTPSKALISTLDSFEGTPRLAPEHDPESSMEGSGAVPRAGEDGQTAYRLAFRLAPPSTSRRDVWCSLVLRDQLDWRGATGLSLAVRADGVYRFAVQVRDENPASADEGTEWWFASVRTSKDWRTVQIPFASLRSLNPKTDGRLDLDRIRGLALVLDRGTVRLGSSGQILVDRIGLY